MRLAALLAAGCLVGAAPGAAAWSTKGHKTTAYIAKRHLTTAAWQRTEELLGGSIVYWASWLDQARYMDEYEYTSTWHYINVDANEDYDSRYHDPAGDAIYAIETTAEVLADPQATDEEKAFALKALCHVVGDLHQPLHCGHKSDLGGNYITIYYNGSSKNLHSFWDYDIVEAAHPSWTYYDWQQSIDNLDEEVEAGIAGGTADDWGRETVAVAAQVYADFPARTTVTADLISRWTQRVETQMLRGGLRLAQLINESLDPDFNGVEGVKADATDGDGLVDVFTLSGTAVRRKVSRAHATEGLQPGFYIVGQKKVAVR